MATTVAPLSSGTVSLSSVVGWLGRVVSHRKDIISLELVTSLAVVYASEKDVAGPRPLPTHLFHAVRHSQGRGAMTRKPSSRRSAASGTSVGLTGGGGAVHAKAHRMADVFPQLEVGGWYAVASMVADLDGGAMIHPNVQTIVRRPPMEAILRVVLC